MPSPLICSSLTANFIRFYYAELAANFIVPLFDFGSFDMSTEPVHSEFLKTFPLALQNLDILNAVRIEFNYVKDNLKKDERVILSFINIKNLFKIVFFILFRMIIQS